jgi:hypothetical protein
MVHTGSNVGQLAVKLNIEQKYTVKLLNGMDHGEHCIGDLGRFFKQPDALPAAWPVTTVNMLLNTLLKICLSTYTNHTY